MLFHLFIFFTFLIHHAKSSTTDSSQQGLDDNVKLIIELQQQIVDQKATINKMVHWETDVKYYRFKLHAAYAMIGVACLALVCYHVVLVRYCKMKIKMNKMQKTGDIEES